MLIKKCNLSIIFGISLTALLFIDFRENIMTEKTQIHKQYFWFSSRSLLETVCVCLSEKFDFFLAVKTRQKSQGDNWQAKNNFGTIDTDRRLWRIDKQLKKSNENKTTTACMLAQFQKMHVPTTAVNWH